MPGSDEECSFLGLRLRFWRRGCAASIAECAHLLLLKHLFVVVVRASSLHIVSASFFLLPSFFCLLSSSFFCPHKPSFFRVHSNPISFFCPEAIQSSSREAPTRCLSLSPSCSSSLFIAMQRRLCAWTLRLSRRSKAMRMSGCSFGFFLNLHDAPPPPRCANT